MWGSLRLAPINEISIVNVLVLQYVHYIIIIIINIGYTCDWIGVGVVNSDFLISSINGGSKPKCEKDTQGLEILYPLTYSM